MEWQVLPNRENHFLDARILARVAVAVLGIDRLAKGARVRKVAPIAPAAAVSPAPSSPPSTPREPEAPGSVPAAPRGGFWDRPRGPRPPRSGGWFGRRR